MRIVIHADCFRGGSARLGATRPGTSIHGGLQSLLSLLMNDLWVITMDTCEMHSTSPSSLPVYVSLAFICQGRVRDMPFVDLLSLLHETLQTSLAIPRLRQFKTLLSSCHAPLHVTKTADAVDDAPNAMLKTVENTKTTT